MEEIIENGVRAYKMDTTTPLDFKSCMKTFADNKDMYLRLLPSFEDSGFLQNLYSMAYWVQVGNYKYSHFFLTFLQNIEKWRTKRIP